MLTACGSLEGTDRVLLAPRCFNKVFCFLNHVRRINKDKEVGVIGFVIILKYFTYFRVTKKLGTAVKDRKRVVRVEAVKARNTWFLVTQPS